MDESAGELMEENSETSLGREMDIVLSINEKNLILNIDENGKIIQFNKLCENIIGYDKNEMINKQFFDVLIPKHSLEQWENFFNSARENKLISDLKLPLLTRDGKEILAIWSNFPVKNDKGTADVGLVGKPIDYKKDSENSLTEQKEKIPKENADRIQLIANNEDVLLFKVGNKKILLKKSKSTKSKEPLDGLKKYADQNKQKDIKSDESQTEKEHKWQKNTDKYLELRRAYNSKRLTKNYNEVVKFIKELEEKNNELETKNKQLEKTLKSLKTRWSKKKKSKKGGPPLDLRKKTGQLIDHSLYSIFTVIDSKRKTEEFERTKLELDERQSMLDSLESQLISDKKSLNERRNEFLKWREKLQKVESEIEVRRRELLEQEQLLDDYLASNLEIQDIQQSMNDDEELLYEDKINKTSTEHHDVLDKISECAAIVQRGILKQVNQSFTEMMGYDAEYLLEKSILDFILPEGLSGFEQYYLQRLKGEAVSSFETIFLTKNKARLKAEIKIKPVLYNDEKAEITVVKILSDKTVKTTNKHEEVV